MVEESASLLWRLETGCKIQVMTNVEGPQQDRMGMLENDASVARAGCNLFLIFC